MSLFDASFALALERAEAMVARAKPLDRDPFAERPAPGMFDLAGQIRCMSGFEMRATLPLAGRPVPEVPADAGLRATPAASRHMVSGLAPAASEGAEARRIGHRAACADLDRSGADYLHLSTIPNLYVHLSMTYAVLRRGGVEAGKAEFDGLHARHDGFVSGPDR